MKSVPDLHSVTVKLVDDIFSMKNYIDTVQDSIASMKKRNGGELFRIFCQIIGLPQSFIDAAASIDVTDPSKVAELSRLIPVEDTRSTVQILIGSEDISDIEEGEVSQVVKTRVAELLSKGLIHRSDYPKIFKLISKRDHEEVLYNTSLMNLISVFEMYMSGLLKHLAYSDPKASLNLSSTFTLGDIIDYTDVDSFINSKVETMIDSLLMKSLEDWREYISTKTGVDISRLSPDYELLLEMMQRRNIIVHNDAKVNGRYRHALSGTKYGSKDLDTALNADQDYLMNAMDNILSTCTALSYEIMKRKSPTECNDRTLIINYLIGNAMAQDRWKVVEYISEGAESDRHIGELGKFTHRTNKLLARKRLRGLSSIKSELSRFDHSMLNTKYSAVVHALSEDFESFYTLVRPGVFTNAELVSWPVLEEVARDARFETLYENEQAQ